MSLVVNKQNGKLCFNLLNNEDSEYYKLIFNITPGLQVAFKVRS